MIQKNNKNKHVVVLLGGWNSENEVSRVSGEGVYKALIEMGYKATKLEFDRNVAEKLKELKPDVVFNALHGRFGEDGKIQGLLDILNIPYTHSGVLPSAIGMNKVLSRKLFDSYGIASPKFAILKKGEDKNNQKIINKIKKPFVIKPINEGSSVGVEVILENMDFNLAKYDWKYGDEIIIERYIKGKELNVAIVGDKALGVIQVVPKHSLFYDYKSKYTAGMTDYIVPELAPRKLKQLLDLSLKCHQIVGCKYISRVEFLLCEKDNKFYLLEINTHPGITPLSLVPKIAKNQGISFNEIIENLINNASCNS